MENTINSLAYKGYIPDAINQSRREKKLFVVYISGEDDTSCSLEQSAFVDEHVAEVIGRCCIFLHLKQGNVDALQFSAIWIGTGFSDVHVRAAVPPYPEQLRIDGPEKFHQPN